MSTSINMSGVGLLSYDPICSLACGLSLSDLQTHNPTEIRIVYTCGPMQYILDVGCVKFASVKWISLASLSPAANHLSSGLRRHIGLTISVRCVCSWGHCSAMYIVSHFASACSYTTVSLVYLCDLF